MDVGVPEAGRVQLFVLGVADKSGERPTARGTCWPPGKIGFHFNVPPSSSSGLLPRFHPYVIPVVAFTDTKPALGIESLAKLRVVCVVWGSESLRDDPVEIVCSRNVADRLSMERRPGRCTP